MAKKGKRGIKNEHKEGDAGGTWVRHAGSEAPATHPVREKAFDAVSGGLLKKSKAALAA